ncbi:MAG TPA: hypothetical protein VGO34_13015 [Alphaproteobacteria bacterium]|jgi:hypothetical protein
MNVTLTGDKQIQLTVSLSLAEFQRALADGRLVVDLTAAPGGADAPALTAEEIAAVCRCYGHESLAANLLWEVAQAGEPGIASGPLKDLLGLSSSQKLAGVFSGLGKTLARLLPGREGLFLIREWQGEAGEYHYRLPADVRAAVIAAYS